MMFKLKAKRKSLASALSKIMGIISSRPSLPILTNVLLEINGDNSSYRLIATDLEMSVIIEKKAEITGNTSIACPAKTFYDMVREMSSQEVIVERIDDKPLLKIQGGAAHFTLRGVNPEGFPQIPQPNESNSIALTKGQLKFIERRTTFATHQDPTRFYMGGVYFHFQDAHLRAVATDTHRLALYKVPMEAMDIEMPEVIIPSRCLQEASKIFDGESENSKISLNFSESQIHFISSSIQLNSRLIAEKFPDYQKVIPTEFSKELKIDRVSFLQLLKRISVLYGAQGGLIKLEMQENSISVEGHDPELGEANETLECSYSSDPFAIGFNGQYLQDTLRIIDSDTVIFKMSNPLSPVKVYEPEKEEEYYCILMPMKLP